jgi:hypothetical protein
MSDDPRAHFVKEAAEATAAIKQVFASYEASGTDRTMLRIATIAQAADDLGKYVGPLNAANTVRLIAAQIDPASAPKAGVADHALAEASRAHADVATRTIDRAKIVVKICSDVTKLAIEELDRGNPEMARQLLAALGTKLLPPAETIQ